MRILATMGILFLSCAFGEAAEPTKTENVFIVMLDGIRWQEMFTGADESLLNKDRGGVTEVDAIKKRFWRETPAERRAALFPFVWSKIAKDGQIFGNPQQRAAGVVTNKLNFSYPGYSEILCGFPDAKITSNNKINNRNVTVLEWLNKRAEFQGKVAAFTSWDVFPYIINSERSGIPVNGGHMPLTGAKESDEVKLLNRLIAENPLTNDDPRSDALTFHAARLYIQEKKPRIVLISFDETDTNAHAGRYDRVLGSCYKADQYVRELWDMIQSTKEYKNKTTLIMTTDHGRGDAPVEWKSHSAKIKGAETWWVGMIGPDTPALGERQQIDTVGQNQLAATVAALLGFDYTKDVPQAGKPLPNVVGPVQK